MRLASVENEVMKNKIECHCNDFEFPQIAHAIKTNALQHRIFVGEKQFFLVRKIFNCYYCSAPIQSLVPT